MASLCHAALLVRHEVLRKSMEEAMRATNVDACGRRRMLRDSEPELTLGAKALLWSQTESLRTDIATAYWDGTVSAGLKHVDDDVVSCWCG